MLSEGRGWSEGVWTEGSYKSSTDSGKYITISKMAQILNEAKHNRDMEVGDLGDLSAPNVLQTCKYSCKGMHLMLQV